MVDEVMHWVAARLRSQRWVWLVPLAVLYATAHWPTDRIVRIMAGLIALAVLTWAIRRPGKALTALMVFLLLQGVGFGFLLRLHVPVKVLRPAGGLKELLGFGIVVSALHALHVGRTRLGKRAQLDAIDKALLAYVAVVTVYLIFPHLFTTFPVSGRWSVRLLAWRADCGYALLAFAVRHAPIPPSARRRFLQVLVALAAMVVLMGFFQWLQPASWSHLILSTGRQVDYQLKVLGNSKDTVTRNLGYLTNRHPLRVSSIFLSPFDMADFLLIPLAIAVERIARDYRSRASYVLCAGILAALFATRVRADALAAVIVVLVALLPMANRPATARLRLLGAILVAAAIVIPSLLGTRFVNAEGGASASRGHVSEIAAGLSALTSEPLGLGIGNVAGVGDRFVMAGNRQGEFTVDNSVLQVGDELGIQTLVPWLVMVVLAWRGLGRAARQADPFAGGIRLAFLAMFVAGMFHHVFLSFPVAWILWAAVGMALRTDNGSGGTEAETLTGNIDQLSPTQPAN